jgi:hypothetical protein
MKVRFLRAAEYASGNADARSFAAGEIVDLRDDLALRWINRGVAELVADAPAAVTEATKPTEEGGEESTAPARPQAGSSRRGRKD